MYSRAPSTPQQRFILSQLAFWMLAATDGHAKNFSIYHRRGGGFGLTPLYDVLSTWPVVGKLADQLDIHELKFAMALRGKNAHYKIVEIQPRHFHPELREREVRMKRTSKHDIASATM